LTGGNGRLNDRQTRQELSGSVGQYYRKKQSHSKRDAFCNLPFMWKVKGIVQKKKENEQYFFKQVQMFLSLLQQICAIFQIF